MHTKRSPKLKELKRRADRFIDWYIAQQEKEEVADLQTHKALVGKVSAN